MRAASLGSRVSRAAFLAAPGSPRTVIDDFLPSDAFAAVAAEFPAPAGLSEEARTAAYAKSVTGDLADFGPATAGVVEALQSPAWLAELEAMTGIPGLVADPSLAPHLAHATPPGGYTRIHRDSLRHPACALYRRVALILYLHPEWDPAWGGTFEAWDSRMRRCVERVVPEPNRAIIFCTTARAWHGFPDPLRCPPGVSRQALTLWYWTETRPAGLRWRSDDAAATFRPRRRSHDPSRWSMRQRPLRHSVVPPALRRGLRRALGRAR